MRSSILKGCQYGSSFTPRVFRIVMGRPSFLTKSAIVSLGSNWSGRIMAWQVEAAVAKVPVLRLEIVKRSDDLKGFVVLPRRWVVAGTFSWFARNRRLT